MVKVAMIFVALVLGVAWLTGCAGPYTGNYHPVTYNPAYSSAPTYCDEPAPYNWQRPFPIQYTPVETTGGYPTIGTPPTQVQLVPSTQFAP